MKNNIEQPKVSAEDLPEAEPVENPETQESSEKSTWESIEFYVEDREDGKTSEQLNQELQEMMLQESPDPGQVDNFLYDNDVDPEQANKFFEKFFPELEELALEKLEEGELSGQETAVLHKIMKDQEDHKKLIKERLKGGRVAIFKGIKERLDAWAESGDDDGKIKKFAKSATAKIAIASLVVFIIAGEIGDVSAGESSEDDGEGSNSDSEPNIGIEDVQSRPDLNNTIPIMTEEEVKSDSEEQLETEDSVIGLNSVYSEQWQEGGFLKDHYDKIKNADGNIDELLAFVQGPPKVSRVVSIEGDVVVVEGDGNGESEVDGTADFAIEVKLDDKGVIESFKYLNYSKIDTDLYRHLSKLTKDESKLLNFSNIDDRNYVNFYGTAEITALMEKIETSRQDVKDQEKPAQAESSLEEGEEVAGEDAQPHPDINETIPAVDEEKEEVALNTDSGIRIEQPDLALDIQNIETSMDWRDSNLFKDYYNEIVEASKITNEKLPIPFYNNPPLTSRVVDIEDNMVVIECDGNQKVKVNGVADFAVKLKINGKGGIDSVDYLDYEKIDIHLRAHERSGDLTDEQTKLNSMDVSERDYNNFYGKPEISRLVKKIQAEPDFSGFHLESPTLE